jgi:hypothetical protein
MGLDVDPRELRRGENTSYGKNVPIDLNRPKGKGVKMVPADLVSIRLDYEDSN